MATTVDFLRHGEVLGGAYYRGSTDDLLSQQGWQQMHLAVANKSWNHIITSPLHRCLDFAQVISRQSNTSLSIEADWQEFHFGDWEGKTAKQINSDELTQFYQDPVHYLPPNAENFSAFLSRIQHAWSILLKQNKGKQALVITHAGVIRALFPLLLSIPIDKFFNLQIDCGGLTRFRCFQDKPDVFVQLIFHNLLRHQPL